MDLFLDVAGLVAPGLAWVDGLLEAAAEGVDALVSVGGGVALLALGRSFVVRLDVFPLVANLLPSVLEDLGPLGVRGGVAVVAGLEQLGGRVDLDTVGDVGELSVVGLDLLEAVGPGEVHGAAEDAGHLLSGVGSGLIEAAAGGLALLGGGDLVEDLAELGVLVEASLAKGDVDGGALGVVGGRAGRGHDGLDTATVVADWITTDTGVLAVTALWVEEALVLGDAGLTATGDTLGVGSPPFVSGLLFG